ncbi:hypothetical protein [Streptomyces ossamyceticus]|uniref:hypothetical protein n=1 Tax=Streptomyces ossamyceticus TaxID=249581 RepID=UPI0034180657
MSESVQITDVLLGLAVGVAVIAALTALRRRGRYQGPDPEPYAGFRQGNGRVGGGRLVVLPCEGHCPGDSTHETDGDDGATCVLCGTHRSALPGRAVVDEA